MSTQTAPAEPAVTASEIAVELACSLDTVYRMANNAEIPGFRVGREWRFFSSVVRAHLSKPRDRWAQPKRSRARKRVG
jgi:excisionase family DNA binding protein